VTTATIGDMTKKRGYSKAFTPKTERRVMLTIDRIPPTLYDAVKAKAKREGISLRPLVLGWLKDWVAKEAVSVAHEAKDGK
jgi:predicted HicB family RNase H-like nuclease